MVIIGKRAGQLGNRLFVFAHIIANAIEYGYEVQNPSFYGYSQYFLGTQNDFYCRYPVRSSRRLTPALQPLLYRFINKIVLPLSKSDTISKLFNITLLDITRTKHTDDCFDMNRPDYTTLATSNSHVLIKDAWMFRDFIHIHKHAGQIRAFFTPVEKHSSAVSNLISRARKDCDLLVGVHLRQGDYKRWQGGRYYFTTAEYAAIMKRFAATMPDKKLRFLICSNEKQDEGTFKGLHIVMGNDHPLEDMYAFAQCDFLIGPPSTYTGWASFYGSVPLYSLQTVDDVFCADDFHVSHG